MGREAKINNKLTRKQDTFVKSILGGQSATQAVLTAYDTSDPNVAKVIASENLTKPNVKEALEEALRSNGLSLSVITGNLGNLANSKPEKISGDTVLKANTELLKLIGAYPDKKSFQMSVSVKTNIASMTREEVERELKEVDADLAELMDDTHLRYTPKRV